MAYHVFLSPSRYIQGVGAIDILGKETAVYGKRAFLLTDDFVWGLLQEKVERALEGFPYHYEAFTGEAQHHAAGRAASAGCAVSYEADAGPGGAGVPDG